MEEAEILARIWEEAIQKNECADVNLAKRSHLEDYCKYNLAVASRLVMACVKIQPFLVD